MRASRVILGILSIICGIVCFAVPTFGISLIGWALTILMVISGINAIAGYVNSNTAGTKNEMYMGGGSLILGVILLIFSIIAIFNPGVRGFLETFILIMFVIGLIFKGINMIATGIMIPGSGILLIFPGILLLIVGCYGVASLFYAAAVVGVFFGLGFLVFGISMLCGDYQFTRK